MWLVLLVGFLKLGMATTKNNVCGSFQDYENIDNSKNCWFSPDIGTTPEVLARNHGFELQNHRVVTEDGYVLTAFRLQDPFSKRRKQPIFLHHGLFATGVFFMTAGNRSLAFYLAENGYDVWLGNHRGTIYSSSHLHMNTSNPQMWNFSFHEIGTFDLPAVLEYISEKTENFTKIIYIGHSMGSTACFVYSSLKPAHAEKYLKGFIAVSPPTVMKHFPSPFRNLVPLVKSLQESMLAENLTVMIPHPRNYLQMQGQLCKRNFQVCATVMALVLGEDSKENMPEDIITLMSYLPSRTALKCITHFAQIITAGRFQQYDHKKFNNFKKYNSTSPPLYPLENITIPVHLFIGLNDNLISEKDVRWTFNQLKSSKKSMHIVPEKPIIKYNHISFLFGKNVKQYFYKPLMDLVTKLENSK